MRIRRHARPQSHHERVREDLAQAQAPPSADGRVCGESCTIRCPQCGSTGCQCKCSALCPEASWALSSDPTRHPIEPGIVPLVFEMTRLGMFEPCWSCEGHTQADGAVSKVPRVWFNCASMVHVRLLASGVTRLRARGMLQQAWHVVVTYSDEDNPEATFSLESAPAPGVAPTLAALQADAATIAQALRSIMSEEARAVQHEVANAR
jgi:hypothetical protein